MPPWMTLTVHLQWQGRQMGAEMLSGLPLSRACSSRWQCQVSLSPPCPRLS